jgi:hypothetical protein
MLGFMPALTAQASWAFRLACQRPAKGMSMWFLVRVVKGSKHFEPDSRVGNQVLISDTTDMVISARTTGADDYRFEMRKGLDTFVIRDFVGVQAPGVILAKFEDLALRMGALAITGDA